MKLKNYKKPWTQEDIDYLEWFYQNPEEGSIKSVAEFLGRTPESIKTKYYELRKQGLLEYPSSINKKWTEEERQYVLDNYGKIPNKEMARKLGVSTARIIQLNWYHTHKNKSMKGLDK